MTNIRVNQTFSNQNFDGNFFANNTILACFFLFFLIID